MVHPGLCYLIELGRDVLERAIPQAMLRRTRSMYCSGTCHHDLRVWLFTHYALTLEIMTAGYASILQPPTSGSNVENPIRLLWSLFDTDIGPRIRSLTIRLNRCILFCGVPIDQYGNSLWKGVSPDMIFSATNPIHASRSRIGEDEFRALFSGRPAQLRRGVDAGATYGSIDVRG